MAFKGNDAYTFKLHNINSQRLILALRGFCCCIGEYWRHYGRYER